MLEILWRHPDFVAVNKPFGVPVHREEGATGLTKTLAGQLGIGQVWLLHRLDKATSGVLLFALNPQSASALSQQFAAKTMHKTYLALATDKPAKKQGWVKGGMEKSRRGTWKLTRGTDNPAVTEFTSRSLKPGMRLFILHPHTGKTHQLRVAMKSLGSPILGDTAYGGKPAARMFLHAWKIRFEYQNQTFEITAPLGEEWQLPEDVLLRADFKKGCPNEPQHGHTSEKTRQKGKRSSENNQEQLGSSPNNPFY